MEIRNYTESDLETCRELWVQLTERHREIYEDPSIGGDDVGLQFDRHLALVGADRVWLAEVDGKVVGMVALMPENDDGDLEMEPLIVSPEARGAGIGRSLVQHVFAVARDLGRDVMVRAVGRNDEAIRFYHEMGFDIVGYFEFFHDSRPRSEQHWRDGETVADRRFRV
jgi:putative acetyltransferase